MTGHTLRLKCKDRDFAEHFREAVIATWFSHRYGRHKPPEITIKDGLYHFRVGSEAYVSKVRSLMRRGFGTRNWRVPVSVIVGPENVKRSFLRGFFDSEGYVSLAECSCMVAATSTNLEGLKEIAHLLKSMDIRCRVLLRRGSRREFVYDRVCSCVPVYDLKIYQPNIDPFAKLIGFSIERKAEKLKGVLSRSRKYRFGSYPPSFYQKALDLRKQGMKVPQIAAELSAPCPTVRHWFRYGFHANQDRRPASRLIMKT